jgi:hypothetical protein
MFQCNIIEKLRKKLSLALGKAVGQEVVAALRAEPGAINALDRQRLLRSPPPVHLAPAQVFG